MSEIKITKENFDQITSSGTVLLDFWAPWCGPCRMIAPIVEEIAAEREDITVGKVNVDEEAELAIRFGITSIPTLIVLENGQKRSQLIGLRSKEDILKLL